MASRVRGNVHARFRGGEKTVIVSKSYLFLYAKKSEEHDRVKHNIFE